MTSERTLKEERKEITKTINNKVGVWVRHDVVKCPVN